LSFFQFDPNDPSEQTGAAVFFIRPVTTSADSYLGRLRAIRLYSVHFD
jgi:hypothetical protein